MPSEKRYDIPVGEYTHNVYYRINADYIKPFTDACRASRMVIGHLMDAFMEKVIDHFEGDEPADRKIVDLIDRSKKEACWTELKSMKRKGLGYGGTSNIVFKFNKLCRENDVKTAMLINLFVESVINYEAELKKNDPYACLNQ